MDYDYYGFHLRMPFRCQFLAPAPQAGICGARFARSPRQNEPFAGAEERILFQTCQAAQTIPIYRLSRPRALERLRETAAFLERACEKFDNLPCENLLLT